MIDLSEKETREQYIDESLKEEGLEECVEVVEGGVVRHYLKIMSVSGVGGYKSLNNSNIC